MDLQTCLIPCAGEGIRARPYTDKIPKAMLEIQGKPVLQHTIEFVRDQLFITHFVIVIGYLGNAIKNHFKSGSSLNVQLQYINNKDLDRGLAWSIYLARKSVESPFLAILGDEYYRGTDHFQLSSLSMDDNIALCGVMETDDRQLIRENYAVRQEGNRLKRLIEKPDLVTNSLLGTGSFVFTTEIFNHISHSYRGGANHVDFISLLDKLCGQGINMETFLLAGDYVNINDRGSLKKANRISLKKGR